MQNLTYKDVKDYCFWNVNSNILEILNFMMILKMHILLTRENNTSQEIFPFLLFYEIGSLISRSSIVWIFFFLIME